MRLVCLRSSAWLTPATPSPVTKSNSHVFFFWQDTRDSTGGASAWEFCVRSVVATRTHVKWMGRSLSPQFPAYITPPWIFPNKLGMAHRWINPLCSLCHRAYSFNFKATSLDNLDHEYHAKLTPMICKASLFVQKKNSLHSLTWTVSTAQGRHAHYTGANLLRCIPVLRAWPIIRYHWYHTWPLVSVPKIS